MKNLGGLNYAYIYRLNTKIRLTMLCSSGFELYSRWVSLWPLTLVCKVVRRLSLTVAQKPLLAGYLKSREPENLLNVHCH